MVYPKIPVLVATITDGGCMISHGWFWSLQTLLGMSVAPILPPLSTPTPAVKVC